MDPVVSPLRTVWYTYWDGGRVANITVRDVDEQVPTMRFQRRDLCLYYNNNGTLWVAVWDRWQVDSFGNISNYQRDQGVEFRFDSARQRYLVREVDVQDDPPTLTPVGAQQWTDYLGQMPYADYDVDSATGAATERSAYLPGLGLAAIHDVAAQTTAYLHGDLIDSTVLTTNSAGLADETFAYTAFGEAITPDGQGGWQIGFPPAGASTRYRYAGGWGYEDDLLALSGPNPDLPPITLQHVGHRWYEPAIGRFVQRDPIGISGGLNVYVYCVNNPLVFIDPLGNEIVRTDAPWYVDWFLTATGGMDSWLDNENTVNKAVMTTLSVPLGVAAGATAPVATCIALATYATGRHLGFLGPNDVLDSVATGMGIGTIGTQLPKFVTPKLRTFGPQPGSGGNIWGPKW